MWPSWAEPFAEIPEFEADFRNYLLYMMMIVTCRQITGFISCVFCVRLNVLNRHTEKERPSAHAQSLIASKT